MKKTINLLRPADRTKEQEIFKCNMKKMKLPYHTETLSNEISDSIKSIITILENDEIDKNQIIKKMLDLNYKNISIKGDQLILELTDHESGIKFIVGTDTLIKWINNYKKEEFTIESLVEYVHYEMNNHLISKKCWDSIDEDFINKILKENEFIIGGSK